MTTKDYFFNVSERGNLQIMSVWPGFWFFANHIKLIFFCHRESVLRNFFLLLFCFAREIQKKKQKTKKKPRTTTTTTTNKQKKKTRNHPLRMGLRILLECNIKFLSKQEIGVNNSVDLHLVHAVRKQPGSLFDSYNLQYRSESVCWCDL